MIANLGHGMKRKLLQLFNTSWKTGRIPQAWKVAYMTPIKQGKDKGRVESYRPISLLSCFCKTTADLALRKQEHTNRRASRF